MSRPTPEQRRRWYAPEAKDIVVWRPNGTSRHLADGARYEVVAVEADGQLRLRERLFGESVRPAANKHGAYFVIETAEERLMEEMLS